MSDMVPKNNNSKSRNVLHNTKCYAKNIFGYFVHGFTTSICMCIRNLLRRYLSRSLYLIPQERQV